MPRAILAESLEDEGGQERLLESSVVVAESRLCGRTNAELAEYLQVAKKAKVVNFDVFLTSVVTLTIFPGVASEAEASKNSRPTNELRYVPFSAKHLVTGSE